MVKKFKIALITLSAVALILAATLSFYSCHLNPGERVTENPLEDYSFILNNSKWTKIEGRVFNSPVGVVNECCGLEFKKSGDSYLVVLNLNDTTFAGNGTFSFNEDSTDSGKLTVYGTDTVFDIHFSENTDSYNCRLSLSLSEYLDFNCKKTK